VSLHIKCGEIWDGLTIDILLVDALHIKSGEIWDGLTIDILLVDAWYPSCSS
jgi:hypothetical protein